MANVPTIARVTVHPVTYAEPNDNNSMRFLTFVRIESTDGHVGWGEAITQFPGSTRGTVEIIKGLADDLIGKDPTQNIGIWRDIRKQTWWYSYRGGLAHFALSAIDIALWDLKGKITGQSLIQMIGKRVNVLVEGVDFTLNLIEATFDAVYFLRDRNRVVNVETETCQFQ